MENKSSTGRRDGPRLVRTDKRAERDPAGPAVSDLQREFEKRVHLNKTGHVNDITRNR